MVEPEPKKDTKSWSELAFFLLLIGCSHSFDSQGTADKATCGFGRADSRCSGNFVGNVPKRRKKGPCFWPCHGIFDLRNLSEHKMFLQALSAMPDFHSNQLLAIGSFDSPECNGIAAHTAQKGRS
jgi:hypothetical protein